MQTQSLHAIDQSGTIIREDGFDIRHNRGTTSLTVASVIPPVLSKINIQHFLENLKNPRSAQSFLPRQSRKRAALHEHKLRDVLCVTYRLSGETVVFACEGATVFAHDSARVFASGYSTVIVNSAYAKVWVAGAATAHIKDCASEHSTGCVIPSKKNPGRITYKGAAHSGINGDCWKVVKDSCERLTFKRR